MWGGGGGGAGFVLQTNKPGDMKDNEDYYEDKVEEEKPFMNDKGKEFKERKKLQGKGGINYQNLKDKRRKHKEKRKKYIE